MAKVQVITEEEKFKPTKPIADKQERVLQMLRLMELSYHTRPRRKKTIQDPNGPLFIEVKRKHDAKR